MLTGEGQLKVMDFGLAQLAERSRLTKTATILGTPAYMSPEQAQRQPTDRRADIWSLGVVIYEMVTGKSPFEGEREHAVLYAIANEDPEPITALRAGLPMELELIVGKALAKDKEERYQHVEEMIVDLRGLKKSQESGKPVSPQHTLPPSPVAAWKTWLPWALLAVMALAWMVTSQVFRSPETGRAVNRFSFAPQAGIRVLGSSDRAVAISPNGRHIAFAATDEEGNLWVQDLDGREPRAIAGVEGAQGPFWSPDSSFIGFVAGGELKKVPAQGGPATVLCDVPNSGFSGGSWSPDGEVIVFGSRGDIYELPARGGAPTLLIQASEASSEASGQPYISPHFLPAEA